MPGLELSRLLYTEVVRPLLAAGYPGLRYSAALIGPGSEVLGFDSERSTDHDWGPRLQIFLADDGLAGEVTGLLARQLPETFRGWPVAFDDTSGRHGVRHWVQVAGLGTWLTGALGFDPRDGVTLLDWLATPTQRLAEITAGAVFHDGLAGESAGKPVQPAGPEQSGGAAWPAGPGLSAGLEGAAGSERPAGLGQSAGSKRAAGLERAVVPGRGAGPGWPGGLVAAREALAWYPPDVWRYVLACQWARLAEEEAFAGRAAEAGDELGPAIIVARQARHLIRLWLLMARRYPPYSKWLGCALTAAGQASIAPLLRGALTAAGWPDRERMLTGAYQAAARQHNKLGLTPPLDTGVGPYYTRPFLVLGAERFSDALLAQITDPAVAALPPCGTVDQFVDGVGTLGDLARLRALVISQQAAAP
jgi:hypothetical protein